MNNEKIMGLGPRAIWRNFVKLSQIPRASGNEARVREMVLARARALGLEHRMDPVGNLLVRKRGKRDLRETILIQSHLDMVCVARAGTNHDFAKDPLTLHSDGKYVKAEDTSLGADNGIGVAAMLGLMEEHESRPMDFLFTVDEETGLTGALGLDPNFLTTRRMLNFDTAQEGTLIVGCAGGLNISSALSFDTVSPPKGFVPLSLRILKGKGGHSGLDIDKNRVNAIKLLAGMLRDLESKAPFGLVDLRGGNKSNVIPGEAEAVIMASRRDMEPVIKIFGGSYAAGREEYPGTDPELTMDLQPLGENPGKPRVLTRDACGNLLNFLRDIPHGVCSMSEAFPGIVETSLNLATIMMGDDTVTVNMNARSPFDASMDRLADSIQRLGAEFGFHTRTGSRYPGWQPDLGSPLLKKARQVYEKEFGKTPGVRVVHAGLECGVIGSHAPGMDILSFGPTIENMHSPGERVEIDSVGRFWTLLQSLLEEI